MPTLRSTFLAVVFCLAGAGAAISAERHFVVGGNPSGVAVNPVTGELVIQHGAGFENRVSALDPATGVVRDVALPDPVWRVAIDAIRNRAYVMTRAGSHQGALYALELEDLSLQQVVGPRLGRSRQFAVDPGNDRIYAMNDALDTLLAIDGETFAVESFHENQLDGYFDPSEIAAPELADYQVDPVAGGVQVAINAGAEAGFVFTRIEVAGSPPQIVAGSQGVAGFFFGWAGLAHAIDPFAQVLWTDDAFDAEFGNVHQLSWASGQLRLASFPSLVDTAARRYWRNQVRGTRLHLSSVDYTGALHFDQPDWSAGVLSPATRRVYAEVYSALDPYTLTASLLALRSIDADSSASAPFGPSIEPETPIRLGDVNVATNRVYGIGKLEPSDPTGIVEIDEPISVPVPMPTTITLGTPAPDGSITVDLAAEASWAPIGHDVLRIVYQVDSTRGRWLRPPQDGGVAQVQLSGLAPGAHTIHAFATDGQEATLRKFDHTIVVGPIASATFVVPGPPACSNGADDDGDGLVDFPADPGCRTAASELENPHCDDDQDNDGDGGIDWDGGAGAAGPDPQCAGKPWKNAERKTACGLGAEIALALAVARGLHRRR